VIHAAPLVGFALVALGLVLTPGPNMAYLVSRAVTQGPAAGLLSLAGVGSGFIVYLLLAAFGIMAMLFAVPVAYGVLRAAGAAYLAWLAWKTLRSGGSSPFELRTLAPDSPRRLFATGFLTNLLNPKAAVLAPGQVATVFMGQVLPVAVTPVHRACARERPRADAPARCRTDLGEPDRECMHHLQRRDRRAVSAGPAGVGKRAKVRDGWRPRRIGRPDGAGLAAMMR
jgi:threonine/homoserine/homoserine lactone efflux protein